MSQLFPFTVTTDIFLVLFAQGLPVQTVTGGQGGNAYRGGFNLPLLKKKQTPRSGALRVQARAVKLRQIPVVTENLSA